MSYAKNKASYSVYPYYQVENSVSITLELGQSLTLQPGDAIIEVQDESGYKTYLFMDAYNFKASFDVIKDEK